MSDPELSKLKIDKTAVTTKPRKRRRALYSVLVIAAVVTAAAIFFSGVVSPAVDVEVANVTQVYPSQSFTLLNASGYVVAQRKAAVASKITSRLISLAVEEGSVVKMGQIIARLEGDDAKAARDQAIANLSVSRANLEQARAELSDATSSFGRNKELTAKGYVSQAEYDTSEARYKRAVAAVAAAESAIRAGEAALRAAEVNVDYTLIRAPFNGVVLTKNADIGDIVTPLGAASSAKASVVTIADLTSLQVEADVSESNLGKIKVGQPCEITLDAIPNSRFRCDVHMIVPTADRTKATIMVKARFLDEDARILPEMSAKVAFLERPVTPDEQKPHVAVTPAAVRDRDGKKYVFVLREGKAVETILATGLKMGDLVEVLSGVKPGERVIVKPLNRLRDGQRVRVEEK